MAWAAAVSAPAASLLFTNPGGSSIRTDAGNADIGFKFFTQDSPLQVTDLGVWDQDGNGLLGSHQVSLYTESMGLVGRVTVPSGTNGTPVADGGGNVYRFASLASPVTLSPYTPYRLCEVQYTGEPFYEWSCVLTPSAYITRDTIAIVGGWNNLGNSGYIGPNLLFEPQAPLPPGPGLIKVQAVAACSYDNTFGSIGRIPEKTVDGVELQGARALTAAGPFPGQLVNAETFWASLGAGAEADPSQRYITWDFGSAQLVERVAIWNWNWSNPTYSDWAVKALDVYASPDGSAYTFVQSLTLAKPTEADGDPPQITVFDAPFWARYVKFANLTNYVTTEGSANPYRVALNEVSFYSIIPEPGVALLLALGGLALLGGRRRGAPRG